MTIQDPLSLPIVVGQMIDVGPAYIDGVPTKDEVTGLWYIVSNEGNGNYKLGRTSTLVGWEYLVHESRFKMNQNILGKMSQKDMESIIQSKNDIRNVRTCLLVNVEDSPESALAYLSLAMVELDRYIESKLK